MKNNIKKMDTEQLLENYLYDINIFDNIYITLNQNKININGQNYKQYVVDFNDIDNTNYYIIIHEVGKNTILTIIENLSIIENKQIVNSQFLIKSGKSVNNLKIEDLTKYVDFKIAELVIDYLD